KAQGKNPPFTYPIKVAEERPHCFKTRQFYDLARHLRARLDSDLLRLDLDVTINNTIAKSGFPDFHFKAMTRPPEYLILIDIPEHREHYTGYADQLVKALMDEGLFISKFFYKNDPRMCFAQPNSQRYFLSDIQQQFSDCRLILIGTGDDLLDPITGEPDDIINELFEIWPDRAILTPRPVHFWGMREKKLQQQFIVQPSTLTGFYTLSLMLNNNIGPLDNIKAISHKSLPPVPENLTDMDAIKKYLGNEHSFQWLCACAMYPELHWNLTIFLGKAIHDHTIEEQDLLRLIQLPWFRNGNIPDEYRQELIAQISKDNQKIVQNIIVDLLEKIRPPKGSYAADTYHLNLAVQRWMLHPKGKKQKHDVQNAVIDDKRISKDFTLLRILDTMPSSPLQLIIPKRLRRVFFSNALPLFGLKAGIRLMGAIAIAMALIFAASFPDLANFFKASNEKVSQTVEIEKVLPAKLTVHVTPPDSEINFTKIKQTYYPGMELNPGSYIIQVSKLAYSPKTLTLTLLSGEHTVKEVSLDKTSTIKIWTEPITGMEFVWVKGGCFMMGQTQEEKEELIKDVGKSTYEKYYQDELPRHEVCVDDFWMGRYEVTVGQFKLFADETGYQTDAEKEGSAYGYDDQNNWGEQKGHNWKKTNFDQNESHPVVNISWNDANELVKWLTTKSKGNFRLPSEAEWEFACRAGTTQARYWGNSPDQACDYANVADQTAKTVFKDWTIHQCTDIYVYTAPIGTFSPNAFGLHDMLGNAWEWCIDKYAKDAYSKHKRNNPIYDETGASLRVLRGGSW
ncbi:Sulphatase-modifying factor domain protein, partial [Candidatus Magnetomorum sp. HK-1]